jgi:hypothetical protein
MTSEGVTGDYPRKLQKFASRTRIGYEQALFHRFIKLLGLEDMCRFEGVRQLAEQENVEAFTHKRVAL